MRRKILFPLAFVLLVCIGMLDAQNANADNVRFYADYPTSPLGVFEKGDAVKIKLMSEDGSDISGPLTIAAYDGTNVYEDASSVIESGTEISLSDLQIGHYTVKFGTSGEDYFSVTVPESERQEYDSTPFAADAAAVWSVPLDMHPYYADAAKKAGISWIRERLSWEQINYKSGLYDLSTLKYEALGAPRVAVRYDLFLKNYKDKGIKVLPMIASQASGTSKGWNTALGKFNPGTITTDLKEAYDYGYYIGSELGDIGAYELWNEPELEIYNYESPDAFTAMAKALSIGVKDGSGGQPVATPGLASRKKTYFVDLFMKNDILDYVDMYNHHIHRQPGSESEKLKHLPNAVQIHRDLLSAYDADDMPGIVTECGMLYKVDADKTSLTQEQQKISSNYNVVSTVESISQGTDKHYWYLFRSSYTGSGDTGMFNIHHHPTMIYSAEAAMTYLLGEGKYSGTLKNMPDGAYGYVFESKGKHTAVLFAESECTYTGSFAKDATVYDIMGNEKNKYSAGKQVSISLSETPVYLALDGMFDADVYTDEGRVRSTQVKESFSASKRVIINQVYQNTVSEGAVDHPMNSTVHKDVKSTGYKISGETKISVEVTNLNNTPMSGIIYGNGFTYANLDKKSENVTLEPWEKKTVEFTVNLSDDCPENQLLPIVFYGEFNGEKTSKSVSVYTKENLDDISAHTVKDDIYSNWKKSSSSALSIEKATKDSKNTVKFTNSWAADFARDRWSCPSIEVNGSEALKNTQGLVLEYYFEAPEPPSGEAVAPSYDKATFSVLVTEKTSGATYKEAPGYKLEPGKWQKIYIPWSRFGIHSGTDDNMMLDPEEIVEISPSLNTVENGIFIHHISSIGAYSLNECEIYSEPTNLVSAEINDVNPTLDLLVTERKVGVDIDNTAAYIDGMRATVDKAENGLSIKAQHCVLPGTHDLKLCLRYEDGYATIFESSFSQSVDVKPITLNGQDFKTGPSVWRIILDENENDSELRQIQMQLEDSAAVPADGLWASAEFYAPESGMYSFSGLISDYASQWFSPYYVKINDEEYTASKDMVKSCTNPDNLTNLKKTVFNDVYLKKGINTVTFMMNEERKGGNGGYFLRISDIEFKLNTVINDTETVKLKTMFINQYKYKGRRTAEKVDQYGVVANVVSDRDMTADLIIAEYDTTGSRVINVKIIDDYTLSEGNNMVNVRLDGIFTNSMTENKIKIFAVSDTGNLIPLTQSAEL